MISADSQYRRALIVGAGQGLSASLARALIGRGIDVALAARDIEKLRADAKIAQIRTMEQSRQVLTPEQREKLRAVLAQRWQHRGPQPGPGTRGMAPEEDGTHRPATTG